MNNKSKAERSHHGTNKSIPLWFRTPVAQTIALGLVFFFVFASYTTIQFYASTTYGPRLAANSVTAVYASFTTACLLAPSMTNKWGSKTVLFLGVLGYAALVTASLVYFVYGIESIVVYGGAVLGVGAALLWTAQGRLILDYAAVEPEQSGTLMGIFWAVFQGSALVGGAVSFLFYSESPTGGSVSLYLIFLAFILLGALSTQLLLPSYMLVTTVSSKHPSQPSSATVPSPHDETASLLAGTTSSSVRSLASVDTQPGEIVTNYNHESSSSSWIEHTQKTLQLFRAKPMLILSVLFFYTGYNQAYQQSTFSNRFFSKRTIGLEMIVFHALEILGAVYVGQALDANPRQKQSLAIQCLILFLLVNATGNLLAWYQEDCAATNTVAVDIRDHASITRPSLALACWGFADSQIQVYVYWLLGILYETGDDHARAVGFYKCIQSLGVSIGFALTPQTRLKAMTQLALSSTIFALGTFLAFFQLPPKS